MMPEALTDTERLQLLRELAQLASDSDVHPDILDVFLPLPAYSQALQPRFMIIRGERGAGKTCLFHALRRASERDLPFQQVFPGSQVNDALWIEGFSEKGKSHPTPENLVEFARKTPEDDQLRLFWLAHLAGRLSAELSPEQPLPDPFIHAWYDALNDPGQWVSQARPVLGALSKWLDELDSALIAQGKTAYLIYDHLDKIGVQEPKIRQRYASTLLALWLSLSNRYSAIRAKIFLREDLFRASIRGSADASKLDSRSISLAWDTESLYRVLIRHMAHETGLNGWIQDPPHPIRLLQTEHLGWMPPSPFPEDGDVSQLAFASHLVGPQMGKGLNKGYVHRWIPNHLQDAHGAIVPRSIINLVAYAATWALQHRPKAGQRRLLDPSELQAGLEQTSQRRVAELAEEHEVIRRFELLRGLRVMAEPAEVIRRLSQPVPGAPDSFGDDGEAVMDELIRIGVLKPRENNRIDVPDIYRYGYDIKRRGGVARPV